MRRILWLFALLASLPVAAQYSPPPTGFSQSSNAFWAAGKSSQLAGTTSSGVVPLSISTSTTAPQVQVFNTGTTVVFVACGLSSIAVSAGSAGTATSDYPVAAGSVIVITPQKGSGYCAAIYGTGSGTVYFTPGAGL